MIDVTAQRHTAPPWTTSGPWLTTPNGEPLTLANMRGHMVVALGFQKVCPGCVQYALPQLARLRRAFLPARIALPGLNMVSEHHGVNTAEALVVFAHEYRFDFPIGIDAPDPQGDRTPVTMAPFAMQGTPTLPCGRAAITLAAAAACRCGGSLVRPPRRAPAAAPRIPSRP